MILKKKKKQRAVGIPALSSKKVASETFLPDNQSTPENVLIGWKIVPRSTAEFICPHISILLCFLAAYKPPGSLRGSGTTGDDPHQYFHLGFAAMYAT